MTGSIDPLRAQFEAFKSLPRDTPIHMLNLIRLKALAAYPEDHPDHGKGLSGLDAYRAYGRTSAEIFKRVGGKQIDAQPRGSDRIGFLRNQLAAMFEPLTRAGKCERDQQAHQAKDRSLHRADSLFFAVRIERVPANRESASDFQKRHDRAEQKQQHKSE